MDRDKSLMMFGLRLKDFRLQKKMSQESLAEICNLDRTYISGLERGLRNPSLICILRVSRGLGINASDLVEGLGCKNDR